MFTEIIAKIVLLLTIAYIVVRAIRKERELKQSRAFDREIEDKIKLMEE